MASPEQSSARSVAFGEGQVENDVPKGLNKNSVARLSFEYLDLPEIKRGSTGEWGFDFANEDVFQYLKKLEEYGIETHILAAYRRKPRDW